MQFGKFEILTKLTSGGMAEIYLAQQPMLSGSGRTVVLKRIRPEFAQDREFVAGFLNEARLCARLTHPNIAQVYDAGQVGDEYFIAMEYVRGVDLSALLATLHARGERLPLPVALTLFCDLCEGLDFAHRARGDLGEELGIVHRDVTPSNVLVSLDGIAKIADFGIAKATHTGEKNTVTGTIKGKYAYLSPEQLDALPIDKRVDVFTAGIILYEMLVGANPFRRDNEFQTLIAIRDAAPPPLDLVGASAALRDDLDRVVRGCLHKDRTSRTGSLRLALEQVQAVAVKHAIVISHASVESLVVQRHADVLAHGSNATPGLETRDANEPSTTLSARVGVPLADTKIVSASLRADMSGTVPSRQRARVLVGAVVVACVVGLLAVAATLTPSSVSPGTGVVPASLASLSVESVPAGASLLVDGVLLSGRTPMRLDSLPAQSEHRVRLVLDGHRHWEQTVLLNAGENQVRAVFEPLVPPLPAPRAVASPPAATALAKAPTVGRVVEPTSTGVSRIICRVTSPVGSWAHVSLDGRLIGDTPLLPIVVTPGPHVVVFENEELGRRVVRNVTSKPGETLTVEVKLIE